MSTLTPRLIQKFIVISCLVFCSAFSFAQGDADYEAAKQQAIALYKQGRMTDVLPIAENLYAKNPKDMQVVELYAFSTFASTLTMKDPAERKQARKKARDLAVIARELGDDSNLLKTILEVPADGGGEDGYSKRKDVDAAMREAETAFARGDYKKALAAYSVAFQLDPNLYTAALFSGDVYYKQGDVQKAGEWFAKAIEINPHAETAYRYWGDALMNVAKKKEESRDKFIDAIIAQPYDRRAWMGLTQWGEKYGVKLGHPRVDVPKNSVQRKDDKNVNIFLSPNDKKDGSEAWFAYSIARAAWMTDEKRKEEFPNEKEYRHSLREEVAALKMVTDVVAGNVKEKKVKEIALDISVANLLKLQQADLLEPYILFVQADQGIAQDYAAYRKSNRDKLRKYLSEVVVNGGQLGN